MDFLYLIFYASLRLRFLDVFQLSAEYSVVINGARPGTLVT